MGNTTVCSDNTFNNTGNITFPSSSGTKSTMANATGKTLRIFYRNEKIRVENMLVDCGTTKKLFKPKTKIDFIDLSPNRYLAITSLREGYVSFFLKHSEDGEVYVETISLNYPLPYGACCIVTAKNEIKSRKKNGGIWIDEDGHDHYTH